LAGKQENLPGLHGWQRNKKTFQDFTVGSETRKPSRTSRLAAKQENTLPRGATTCFFD
jgi:hypothetical protein